MRPTMATALQKADDDAWSLDPEVEKRYRKRQTETYVREAGRKFLETRGWTVIRYDSARYVGWGVVRQFAEKAKAWAFAIAAKRSPGPFPQMPFPHSVGKRHWPDLIALRHNFSHGWDQVLFLEAKAAKKKPDPDQVKVHEMLRKLGYCVVWFDCVKTGGKMSLAEWYEGEGL